MDEEERELIHFHQVASVAPSGELKVNAGQYSRAMIVMAFEMMGGVEEFTIWALDNKSEFYTKMFNKIIGREPVGDGGDEVENYLAILDMEAEDVTPPQATPELEEFVSENLTSAKLAEAAKLYTHGEPLD